MGQTIWHHSSPVPYCSKHSNRVVVQLLYQRGPGEGEGGRSYWTTSILCFLYIQFHFNENRQVRIFLDIFSHCRCIFPFSFISAAQSFLGLGDGKVSIVYITVDGKTCIYRLLVYTVRMLQCMCGCGCTLRVLQCMCGCGCALRLMCGCGCTLCVGVHCEGALVHVGDFTSPFQIGGATMCMFIESELFLYCIMATPIGHTHWPHAVNIRTLALALDEKGSPGEFCRRLETFLSPRMLQLSQHLTEFSNKPKLPRYHMFPHQCTSTFTP